MNTYHSISFLYFGHRHKRLLCFTSVNLQLAKKLLNYSTSAPIIKSKKMRTTVLLFALIFGCMIPTYSQINRHRKIDTRAEQFLVKKNKKSNDFGNYNFVWKFSDVWSNGALDSFNMSPISPAPAPRKFIKEIYSGDDIPCYKPKGNHNTPCYDPEGLFSMRVYKPESVIWGTLYSDTDSIVR